MPALPYQFGEFRLDPATRSLWRAGEPLTLAPKVFDCIVYLLEHRERAVGRDELISAVWGRIDIADGVLGQTILLARRALDDDGRGQQVIRTITRFGYHWQARVEQPDIAEAAHEPPAAAPAAHSDNGGDGTATRPAALRRAHRHATPAVAMIAILILSATVGWFALRPRAVAPPTLPASGAATSNAALVLPVAVLGDPRASWVRLGVMDLVADRLRTAGQPIVPSDNVVALARAYDQAAVDPAQLGALAAAAGASLVVDARAEAFEGTWRVSLRTVLGHEPAASASAQDTDVLVAARIAADQLAAALGLSRAVGGSLASDPLVQEIEAALLDERVADARILLARATPRQRARPVVRFQAGRMHFQAGELDAAEAAFRALAAGVDATDEPTLYGEALNAIGGIALQRQQAAAALPSFDRAIEVLGQADAPAALGKAYGNRAAAHALQRDYGAALSDLASARIALARAGDMLGLAVLDSNAGVLAMNRERFAEAAPILSASAARFAAFRAHAPQLNALCNLAQTQLALLDDAAALASATAIADLVDRVPDPERQRAVNLVRAQAMLANGRLAEAERLLRDVRAGAAGDSANHARAHAIAAQVAWARGDSEWSGRSAKAALEPPAVPGDARDTGMAWLLLVRSRLAATDIQGAGRALADARAWAARDGSAVAALHVAVAQGLHDAAGGSDAAAIRGIFEQAMQLAERDRVPVDLLTVTRAYVEWLLPRGELRRAGAAVEALSPWIARDYEASLLQLRLFHALGDPNGWQAALAQTRRLAGEREIPASLVRSP